MMYKTGFSGEVEGQWVKMDLAVDETDVRQFFAEHNIVYDEKMKISTTQKYKLMEALAEMYVLAHQMSRFAVYRTQANKELLEGYKATQKTILEQMKYAEAAPF